MRRLASCCCSRCLAEAPCPRWRRAIRRCAETGRGGAGTAEAQTAKLEQAASQGAQRSRAPACRTRPLRRRRSKRRKRVSAPPMRGSGWPRLLSPRTVGSLRRAAAGSSLLAGLATWRAGPPACARRRGRRGRAGQGPPAARRHAAGDPGTHGPLSAELAQGQGFGSRRSPPKAELSRSRASSSTGASGCGARGKADAAGAPSGGQALGTSDVAMAAGENVEQLRGAAGQQPGSASSRTSLRARSRSAKPVCPRRSRRRDRPLRTSYPRQCPVTEGWRRRRQRRSLARSDARDARAARPSPRRRTAR